MSESGWTIVGGVEGEKRAMTAVRTAAEAPPSVATDDSRDDTVFGVLRDDEESSEGVQQQQPRKQKKKQKELAAAHKAKPGKKPSKPVFEEKKKKRSGPPGGTFKGEEVVFVESSKEKAEKEKEKEKKARTAAAATAAAAAKAKEKEKESGPKGRPITEKTLEEDLKEYDELYPDAREYALTRAAQRFGEYYTSGVNVQGGCAWPANAMDAGVRAKLSAWVATFSEEMVAAFAASLVQMIAVGSKKVKEGAGGFCMVLSCCAVGKPLAVASALGRVRVNVTESDNAHLIAWLVAQTAWVSTALARALWIEHVLPLLLGTAGQEAAIGCAEFIATAQRTHRPDVVVPPELLSKGIPRLTALWSKGRLQPRVSKLYHTLVAIDEVCPSPDQVSPSFFKKLLRSSWDQPQSRYRSAIEQLLVDALAIGAEPCWAAWASAHFKCLHQSASLMAHIVASKCEKLDRAMLAATATKIEQANASLLGGEFRDRKGRKVQMKAEYKQAIASSEAACTQLREFLMRSAEPGDEAEESTPAASGDGHKGAQKKKRSSSVHKWTAAIVLVAATGVAWASWRCCDLSFCKGTVLPALSSALGPTIASYLPRCL